MGKRGEREEGTSLSGGIHCLGALFHDGLELVAGVTKRPLEGEGAVGLVDLRAEAEGGGPS